MNLTSQSPGAVWVEVAVLGSPTLIVRVGLCGRTATLNEERLTDLTSPRIAEINDVCVVTDSRSESKDKAFILPATVADILKFT